MPRFARKSEIGLHWLRCGSRLFARNPWLLCGTGFGFTALMIVLTFIPFIGTLLIAGLAPILLASAYLAIDSISRQTARPAPPGMATIRRSGRALICVLQSDERLMPAFVVFIYSIAVALLVAILVRLLAGVAWEKSWLSLDTAVLPGVVAAILLATTIYSLLAASLVYALPLAFLQHEPLVPAAARSLKTCVRHAPALLLILGISLVPPLLGGIASLGSLWGGYIVSLVTGTVVFPLAVSSLYCSYRTIFTVRDTPAGRASAAPPKGSSSPGIRSDARPAARPQPRR